MSKVVLTAEHDLSGRVAVSRFADYFELTKPRIAVMALFTVAIGYLLAAGASANIATLIHTLIGAGLVAAGGSALNQFLERDIDARMRRTANRPLPAGRLQPDETFAFGLILGTAGFVYLLAMVAEPLAAIAAAATFLLYVCVYTPMKTRTVWNTVVGAVPGALPPVIGWCAARGSEGAAGALGLFLVLFFWQLPHFLAIAWMYRRDYAQGGLRMLPIIDATGRWTAAVMIATTFGLIAASLLPVLTGSGGVLYVVGAVACGLFFLYRGIQFASSRTDRASLPHRPSGIVALSARGAGLAAGGSLCNDSSVLTKALEGWTFDRPSRAQESWGFASTRGSQSLTPGYHRSPHPRLKPSVAAIPDITHCDDPDIRYCGESRYQALRRVPISGVGASPNIRCCGESRYQAFRRIQVPFDIELLLKTPNSPMRFVIFSVVLVLGASGCAHRTLPIPPPNRAAENVDYPVGSFSLTDSKGRPITEKDLRGKVWVASFVFTHCTGPCKELTATVTRLQKELANEPDVRFVSITLDPQRDTEAVLRDYAKIAGAKEDRWLFLTGDEATIHDLTEKHFKQSVGAKPKAVSKPGEEFDHSTRLSVVDKKGIIRGYFDGVRSTTLPPEDAEAEYQATFKRLVEKVHELAKEP